MRLYREKGGATWPVIAAEAEVAVDASESLAGEKVQRGIGAKHAKITIHDMVRSGQLEIIGRDKPAGSKHWHAIFAPVQTHVDESHDVEPTQRLGELLSEVHAFG